MTKTLGRGHTVQQKALAILAALALFASLITVYAPPADADDLQYLPGDSEYNEVSDVAAWLNTHDGVTDSVCEKINTESFSDYVADDDYRLVLIKKGSGPEANRLWWDVEAGDVLAPGPNQGDGKGYSHVIVCDNGGTPPPPPEPGKIIVEKKVTDGSDTAKVFTFNADFTLSDDTLAHGESGESGDLDAGTYSVTETVPVGWSLSSATCDDGSAPDAISLDEGETVTCTFLNDQDDEPEEDEPVEVMVTRGECRFDETYGSMTSVSISITPGSGASVAIDHTDDDFDDTYTSNTTITLPPGDVSWSATAADGYELVGESSGEFFIDFDCLTCPEFPEGTIVVDFGGVFVRANGNLSHARKGPFAVSVPEGFYDVTLASFDNHSDKAGQVQEREQYFLDGFDGASGVWASTPISDLPDDVNYMVEKVDTNVYIPGIDNVFVMHPHYPEPSNAQSITALCAGFTPIEQDILPEISVEKTANPTTVAEPGADVEFTVEISNPSTEEDVTIVSIEDDIFGTLAGDADCQVGTTLAPGASCSFVFTEMVTGAAGDQHHNTVTVVGEDEENNEVDDSDDAIVDIVEEETPVTDVAVTKVDLVDPIILDTDNPTAQVTYEVTVVNNGPELAENVVVTDTLPATTTYVSATPEVGSCGHAAGVVTCNLGDMAVGAEVMITIVVQTESLGEVTDVTLLNEVVVETDTAESDLSNNEDEEPTEIVEIKDTEEEATDVSVTKIDLVDPVTVDSDNPTAIVTYEVTVTNNGPIVAENVTVTDTLPATTTYVSATPAVGSCGHAAGIVTCSLGDLAVGVSVKITIKVETEEVGEITDPTLLNVVSVSTTTTDSNPDNDTDDEATNIIEVLDVEVLPFTGIDSDALMLVALALLISGLLTVRFSRRRDEGKHLASR